MLFEFCLETGGPDKRFFEEVMGWDLNPFQPATWQVGQEEAETAAPAEQSAEPIPWQADKRRWRMLGLFALGCMANQAMWIGFAPIEAEVMQRFDVSSTWVNFLSLAFMIAPRLQLAIWVACLLKLFGLKERIPGLQNV